MAHLLRGLNTRFRILRPILPSLHIADSFLSVLGSKAVLHHVRLDLVAIHTVIASSLAAITSDLYDTIFDGPSIRNWSCHIPYYGFFQKIIFTLARKVSFDSSWQKNCVDLRSSSVLHTAPHRTVFGNSADASVDSTDPIYFG